MELTYNLNIDDLVTMNLYNYKTAPVWQKQQQNARFIVALIAVVLSFGATTLVSRNGITILGVVLSLALGIIIFALYPRLTEPTLKKRLAQYFESDSGSGLIGKYTLVVSEEGVKQSTASSTNHYQWNDVERIDITQQYLYLFAAKSNCITVPKGQITGADIDAIIDTAKSHQVSVNYAIPTR